MYMCICVYIYIYIYIHIAGDLCIRGARADHLHVPHGVDLRVPARALRRGGETLPYTRLWYFIIYIKLSTILDFDLLYHTIVDYIRA